MISKNWKDLFEAELQTAQKARESGKEGMARVCARRAAGIVAGEYFLRNRLPDPKPSAYERLKILGSLESVSGEVQELSQHFLVRNTPDFILPIDADLVADARVLAALLLGD